MEFSSYSRTGQIFVLWSNSPKRAFADIEVTDVTNHVLKHLLSVTADGEIEGWWLEQSHEK